MAGVFAGALDVFSLFVQTQEFLYSVPAKVSHRVGDAVLVKALRFGSGSIVDASGALELLLQTVAKVGERTRRYATNQSVYSSCGGDRSDSGGASAGQTFAEAVLGFPRPFVVCVNGGLFPGTDALAAASAGQAAGRLAGAAA